MRLQALVSCPRGHRIMSIILFVFGRARRVSPRSFAAFEVRLMPGVAHVSLVNATSITSRTRIPLATAHETLAPGFVARWMPDDSAVRLVPSSLGIFSLPAVATDHCEDRRHHDHGEFTHHITARPDKSKTCSFHHGRMRQRCARSMLHIRPQDPCNCCDTPTISTCSAPSAQRHRSSRHRPCPCPPGKATRCSRRAEAAYRCS